MLPALDRESPAAVCYLVRNVNRNSSLGTSVLLAGSSSARRKGLLDQTHLFAGSGLWINPSEAIHTFGMNFPIDVAFLDSRLQVLKLRRHMRPRRICMCWRATSVLELHAGSIAESRTQVGDVLEIQRNVA